MGNIPYLCGMIRLNTPTETMTLIEIRQVVKLATKWCVENFGVNNRRHKPFTISIRKYNNKKDRYGQFDEIDNVITIYYGTCKNIKLLIQTLIHEYTHYMQPIRSAYHRLYKEHGYNNHPMEIEARDMEKKYYSETFTYIKKHI